MKKNILGIAFVMIGGVSFFAQSVEIAVTVNRRAKETFTLGDSATIKDLKDAIIKKYQIAPPYSITVEAKNKQLNNTQSIESIEKGIVLHVVYQGGKVYTK